MSIRTDHDPTTAAGGHDGGARRGRDAGSPTAIPASGWKDIAVRVYRQFGEDHVTLAAAGVAFFGFASLVPLLAAGISIYGLVADPSDVTSLVDRIEGTVPQAVADMISQQLDSVVGASTGALGFATVAGIAIGIWSASSGVGHMIEAVGIAYQEDEDSDRSFWTRRAMALGFTVGLLVLIAASGFVIVMGARIGSGAVALLASIAAWLIVAALAATGLALLYRYGPDRRNAQWRWVTPGAAIAIVIWIAASIGFRYYVANFGSYNETYGSLGTVIVVLLWLYLSAMAVIIGAEIDAEIEHQTAEDSTVAPDRPMGRREAQMADTLGEAHR
ncbi:MAG: YihY/virulence factor BrkB family protein [Acidimicrobiales bacterium]